MYLWTFLTECFFFFVCVCVCVCVCGVVGERHFKPNACYFSTDLCFSIVAMKWWQSDMACTRLITGPGLTVGKSFMWALHLCTRLIISTSKTDLGHMVTDFQNSVYWKHKATRSLLSWISGFFWKITYFPKLLETSMFLCLTTLSQLPYVTSPLPLTTNT